ncbi:uncharacterized protein LOC119838071 [Zerene cesonia]|uniref:uncharacterized protein LOC119838071 n=1 Tax=Zerene cesonia TaxID=33412 RepID=UPI0018E56223|nr:uncharacterized protein LOC119838071 [Zerene cesonia]
MYTRNVFLNCFLFFCFTLSVFVFLLCFDFKPVNHYKLEKVVLLSRHNLRTPLSKSLKKLTPQTWPQWKESPGYLTEKGFILEGYMGTFFYNWLSKEGLLSTSCPDENQFYVYANNVQRTMASAQAFVTNAFPTCNVSVHHSKDSYDPIFSPYIHNDTEIFKKLALNEMNAILQNLDLKSAYKSLEHILNYQSSDLCKLEKKCNMQSEENIINITVGAKPLLKGPLKLGNEAIDAFFMEYYSGFSLDRVAWGQLLHTNEWQRILPILQSYHNVIFNTSIVAKDISFPLLKYMAHILTKDDPKITLLMGHDANINVVLNTMEFKPFVLDHEFVNTPIGGKMVFQKWFDTHNKEYLLKIQYVYQSAEQLRNATVLNDENPPRFTVLELKKCPVNEDGFCSWDLFVDFLKSIDIEKAAKGFWIKDRRVPPEILGTTYAEYCDLINRMYDAYLNSVHLQRAPYIIAIINVLMKRMYELRNELVNLIVNDYIYVDQALINTRRTPFDIQIVIPYHLPLECREDSMEQLLQKMWTDAIERKKAPPNKAPVSPNVFDGDFPIEDCAPTFISEQLVLKDESIHTIYSEEFLQALIIQRQERYRQFFVEDFRSKCRRRRLYFADSTQEAPIYLKRAAAMLIQKVYRKYMDIKRQRILEHRRDVLLGLVPDPFQAHLNFEEENNLMYERKRNIRIKIREAYMKDFNQEQTRIVVFKRDNQIDDITDQIRTWFKEWYYGYGFFPDYPYEIEGGTVMVIRGDYPSIAEKVEEDEKYNASVKGKTKEMLKAEKKQAKLDALLKEEADREQKKKEEEQLFKLKCNPQSDPGYMPQTSQHMGEIVEALQRYQAAWSIYDDFPPSQCPDAFFGYMETIMTEDVMGKLHVDCRKYVDELMRLDLKLLIKAQQQMYKDVGWKFPKLRARKKPKAPAVPKPLKIDSALMEGFEALFDHDLISKPTCKIKDIVGDMKYGVYECNLKDPDARIRSMPRDYCVQALAQVLQGYGFGLITELFDKVMNAERVVRLNVTPLSAAEFLGPLIEMGVEATSEADYQEYVNFFITNSPLATKRQKYEVMNQVRAAFYEKMEKKKEKEKS